MRTRTHRDATGAPAKAPRESVAGPHGHGGVQPLTAGMSSGGAEGGVPGDTCTPTSTAAVPPWPSG